MPGQRRAASPLPALRPLRRWVLGPLGPVGLMLSVCLPWAAGRAEEAIRADYRCLGRFDASDVTALFFRRSPAEVVLLEGLQAVRLPQALAASGARYSDGRDSFWVKGDQASWSRGKAPTRQCIPRP